MVAVDDGTGPSNAPARRAAGRSASSRVRCRRPARPGLPSEDPATDVPQHVLHWQHAVTLGLRGGLFRDAGDLAGAESSLRAAVDRADRLGALALRARTGMLLGEVLRAQGRAVESRAMLLVARAHHVVEDAVVVRRAIDEVGGPVVVLAHSYGGIPVSQATAGAPGVTHLVYVAAYSPVPADSGVLGC